jgi:4-amino-4-deoxy-L-arabinose transferase-like glycosyltransferase
MKQFTKPIHDLKQIFSNNSSFLVSFLIIAAVYIFINYLLLLKDPIVFPDETAFATVSYNLINPTDFSSNWFSTHLGQAVIFEMFFHGPVYNFYLAGLFKIIGFGILELRLGSVIIGGLCLGSAYWLAKMMGSKKSAWILVCLLASDYFFFRSARFGRPEVLVMFMSFLGLITYFNWLKSKTRSNLAICYLTAVLTFMSHYLMGSILMISIFLDRLQEKKRKIFLDKFSWGLGLFSLGIFSGWLKIGQMIGQDLNKAVTFGETRLMPSFRSLKAVLTGDELIKSIILVYLIGLVLATVIKQKTRQEKTLVVFSWISIVIMLFGSLDWYLNFIPLIGGFGYFILDQHFLKNKKINHRYTMIMVVSVVIFFNLVEQIRIALAYKDFNYQAYAQTVSDALPPNAKVWVKQLIPDPNLYLAKHRSDLKLVFEAYEDFPQPKSQEQLSKTEYVVDYWSKETEMIQGDQSSKRLIFIENEERGISTQTIPDTLFTSQLVIHKLSDL